VTGGALKNAMGPVRSEFTHESESTSSNSAVDWPSPGCAAIPAAPPGRTRQRPRGLKNSEVMFCVLSGAAHVLLAVMTATSWCSALPSRRTRRLLPNGSVGSYSAVIARAAPEPHAGAPSRDGAMLPVMPEQLHVSGFPKKPPAASVKFRRGGKPQQAAPATRVQPKPARKTAASRQLGHDQI
jgi:hypothetical protein